MVPIMYFRDLFARGLRLISTLNKAIKEELLSFFESKVHMKSNNERGVTQKQHITELKISSIN